MLFPIRNLKYLINPQANLCMGDKVKLGYWPIRGRAQPSRLIMAYCGVEFEEVSYTSPEDWFGRDKQSLGIPFPNLPYLIDGDLKITQSLVIPKYIARKSGKTDLLGKNPKDMALVDSILYAWEQCITQFGSLAVNKKWADQRTAMYYKVKPKLQRFEKLFAERDFCIGYLTIADFIIAEGSIHLQRHFYEEYSQLKSFQKIRASVENLPQVKAYYARPNAIITPIMSPYYAAIPMGIEDIDPKKQIEVPNINKKPSIKSPTKNKTAAFKIVAISGSLRKTSTNTGLIRACIELDHPNLQIEWADISQFPMFNEDLQKIPLPANKNADGVLFAVAQNNFNISACLKNAYDWISRCETPIKEKPAAMVSSAAMSGGMRAQNSMRGTVEYCKVKMMQKPEIAIKRFSGKFFDEDGNLINEETRGN